MKDFDASGKLHYAPFGSGKENKGKIKNKKGHKKNIGEVTIFSKPNIRKLFFLVIIFINYFLSFKQSHRLCLEDTSNQHLYYNLGNFPKV